MLTPFEILASQRSPVIDAQLVSICCKEVYLAFFSSQFITAIVVKPTKRKLTKHTSVRCAHKALSHDIRITNG